MDHYDTIKNLFAQTLAERPGSYIVEELFSRFPSIVDLMSVTEQELMQIKGIGKVRARQILAALELAKKLNVPAEAPYIIRCPQDVATLLIPEMRYLQCEHFVVLFMNIKNGVIAKETISIGSLTASIVHPREVFKAAIKRSSASIIVAHNHPSGNPTPSPEDIQITKRLVEGGSIIGIDVLDHIIIGGDQFYSLKEHGLM
ncbi:JAB domain-containing protein [Paenibacillus sp. JMULE4]|uniref:RadC family protein n=1 Tax=Paenibacillus sp. JMULE4 TaxID=2518342 RepID=UPI00157629E6|nr:DNA repair protein RadC [Paenibacillus sp. JMULE4]NTZ18847.1 JAB domain-containing protein [Paenibacillus sp. JMULE4]